MRQISDLEPIEKANLLLVEGVQDLRFFEALLIHHDRRSVQVESVNGKDGFSRALRQLRRRRGFSRLNWLGLLRDADSDHGARSSIRAFEAMTRDLAAVNLPIPQRAWTVSTDPNALGVVIFIVPFEKSQGYLESWILETHLRQTQLNCARALVTCLGQEAHRSADKIIIAAYLASIDPEKLQIGDAIQIAGTFSLDSPVFAPFIELIPMDDL